MKVKLGQQISFKKSHTIQVEKGDTVTVRPGDTARVVRKISDETGEIVYLTGEAKGLTHIIPIQVDDNLDTDAIVKKLMEELGK